MSSAEKTIALRPAGEVRRLDRPDGFTVASVAVGVHGNAIRLLVPEKHAQSLVARTEQPGWASFPKTHTDTEYSSIVSVSDASGSRVVRLTGLTATFPKMDVFPDGEVLLVASRCYRGPDGNCELNAKVFGLDGQQKNAFVLGDGISHVQSDTKGNIWVGYFDEGVYGNFGWQQDGYPLGAAGVSCFTRDGQRMWDFDPPKGFEPISDCYALNVSRTGAWAYYYTDFPIAFVEPNWRVNAWKTQTSGSRTFAVGNERVLLYGGYGDRRTSCSLLKLQDGAAELVGEVSLLLPGDIDLTKAAVIGRDRELHVFSKDDWYVFSIDSLS